VRRVWKHIRRGGDFVLLGLIFLLTRPLGFRTRQRVGAGLGRFAFRWWPIRKRVVLDNLTAAFGHEKTAGEIEDLARRFYEHLGATLLEFSGLDRLGPGGLDRWAEIEGREHLDAVVAEGRGALLVSGHYGNWELMGAAVAAQGPPLRFLVKTQANRAVDRLQNTIRRRAGIGIIRTDASLREMVRTLREGGFIGLLGDQDAGGGGLFLEFLGRPASVFRGTAQLAYRLRCPILMGFALREADGRHRVLLTPPLSADPAWDEETAVRELTRIHTQRLEAMIRRRPELYFWVHRRWKTQPAEVTP